MGCEMHIPANAQAGLDILEGRNRVLLDRLMAHITPLIDFYRQSSTANRAELRAGLCEDSFRTLNAYAGSIAPMAVRKHAIEDVRRGLAASAMEGGAWDFRETIINLCLLYNAAGSLIADADDLFTEAAMLGNKESKKLIIGYLHKGDKRLESMGYRQGVNDAGEFDFVANRVM